MRKLIVSDTEGHLFFQKYFEIYFLQLLLVTFTFSFKVIFIKFTPLFNFFSTFHDMEKYNSM